MATTQPQSQGINQAGIQRAMACLVATDGAGAISFAQTPDPGIASVAFQGDGSGGIFIVTFTNPQPGGFPAGGAQYAYVGTGHNNAGNVPVFPQQSTFLNASFQVRVVDVTGAAVNLATSNVSISLIVSQPLTA